MHMTPEKFTALIYQEREHQADRFGNGDAAVLDHTDDHKNGPLQFVAYIAAYSTKWFRGGFPPFGLAAEMAFRTCMVKVATLAFAAYASTTRKLKIRDMHWAGDNPRELRRRLSDITSSGRTFNTFRAGTKWADLEHGDLIDLYHTGTEMHLGTYQVVGAAEAGPFVDMETKHGGADKVGPLQAPTPREDVERAYPGMKDDDIVTVVYLAHAVNDYRS